MFSLLTWLSYCDYCDWSCLDPLYGPNFTNPPHSCLSTWSMQQTSSDGDHWTSSYFSSDDLQFSDKVGNIISWRIFLAWQEDSDELGWINFQLTFHTENGHWVGLLNNRYNIFWPPNQPKHVLSTAMSTMPCSDVMSLNRTSVVNLNFITIKLDILLRLKFLLLIQPREFCSIMIQN